MKAHLILSKLECSTCMNYYWRDWFGISHKVCPLEVCSYSRKYKDQSTELRLSRSGRWYWYAQAKNYKQIAKDYWARRHAAGTSITSEEFWALQEACGHKCWYCGRSEDEIGPLTQDHIIPLTRGGTNGLSNIVPACRGCNSQKGSMTVGEYLVWLAEKSR